MRKIPVNIISGFLGSGKTTAIIHLLEQKHPEECWAIVVNEFGKVSIDGQTLHSKSATGSVFDISGGCICCSAKTYLKENLEKIIETQKFDRIIIEPSGLGGIEMVSEIILAFPTLQSSPVICMVDITGLGNPKLQKNLIYHAQIRKAEVISFSKADLTTTENERNHLINKFKKLYPNKCYNLKLTANDLHFAIPEINFPDKNNANNYQTAVPVGQDLSDRNYQEKIYRFDSDLVFELDQLSQILATHPSIIRAKGYIRTKTGWMLFNHTLTGFQTEPCLENESNLLVIISLNDNGKSLEAFGEELEKPLLTSSIHRITSQLKVNQPG